MSILKIKRGIKANLPLLSQGELGVTLDTQELFAGGLAGNFPISVPSLSSYMAFCANVNMESLDAAFGKNNEDRIRGLGLQLAMYAKYKDPTININAQFGELIKCNSLKEINNNLEANSQLYDNSTITNLILSNPYAKENVLPTPYTGYIYNAGNEFVDVTGGWVATVAQGSDQNTAYANKTISELLLKANIASSTDPTCTVSFNSKKPLDLTNKKIKISYKVSKPDSRFIDRFNAYLSINGLGKHKLTWYDIGIQGSFTTSLLTVTQGNIFVEIHSYYDKKFYEGEISIQSIEIIN